MENVSRCSANPPPQGGRGQNMENVSRCSVQWWATRHTGMKTVIGRRQGVAGRPPRAGLPRRAGVARLQPTFAFPAFSLAVARAALALSASALAAAARSAAGLIACCLPAIASTAAFAACWAGATACVSAASLSVAALAAATAWSSAGFALSASAAAALAWAPIRSAAAFKSAFWASFPSAAVIWAAASESALASTWRAGQFRLGERPCRLGPGRPRSWPGARRRRRFWRPMPCRRRLSGRRLAPFGPTALRPGRRPRRHWPCRRRSGGQRFPAGPVPGARPSFAGLAVNWATRLPSAAE